MHDGCLPGPDANHALARILLEVFRDGCSKLLASLAFHLRFARILHQLQNLCRKSSHFARLQAQSVIRHPPGERIGSFDNIEAIHFIARVHHPSFLAEQFGGQNGRRIGTQEIAIERQHNIRLIKGRNGLSHDPGSHLRTQRGVIVMQRFPVQPQCLGPFLSHCRNYAAITIPGIAFGDKCQSRPIAKIAKMIFGKCTKGFPGGSRTVLHHKGGSIGIVKAQQATLRVHVCRTLGGRVNGVAFHLCRAAVVGLNPQPLPHATKIKHRVVVERLARDQVLHALGETDDILHRTTAANHASQTRARRHDFENVASAIAV